MAGVELSVSGVVSYTVSMMGRRLLFVLLAVGLVAVFVVPARLLATKPPPWPVKLDSSLDSLRTLFNAHSDEVRFLAILSPT